MTIKKIANELGVSKTTVHRALNNQGRISKITKEKILNLANELGYTPNDIAKSLRSKKTMTIGFILRGIMVGHYYSQILSGIEEVASEMGYVINIACSGNDSKTERSIIENFNRRQVDGIIIAPVTDSLIDNYDYLRKHGIPFVFIDKYIDSLEADVVTADCYQSIKKAIHVLTTSGRERIAFLNGLENNCITIKQRINAYLEQLLEDRKDFKLIIESADTGTDDKHCGYVAISRYLNNQNSTNLVDAIICANDSLAFGALKAIYRCGLKVPDDIALIGINNDSMTEYVHPMLTTISQPRHEMGVMAMKLLLRRINGNSEVPFSFNSFPTTLLLRETT